MTPYLTIANADKIVGQHGVYIVHGVEETPDWYKFTIGFLGEGTTVISIGRHGAVDKDGRWMFAFYDEYDAVQIESFEWLSDMRNVLNTLVSEYSNFIQQQLKQV